MMLLFSGKGGVGKTTVSAATAVRAAALGHRTLVASLDRAHNLASVLGAGHCDTPTPLSDRLAVVELDPQAELARSWSVVAGPIGHLLRWLGVKGAAADEIAVFPGLEELLLLARLADLAEDPAWDLLIVDLAPTASSLRYLSFPDLMAGTFGRLAKLERLLLGVGRPALRTFSDLPVPDDAFYDALDRMAASLGRLRDRLVDRARTRARLVTLAERIVVDETREAFTALSLYGIAVDGIVVNRLIPPEADGAWLQRWRAAQARELRRLDEVLPGVPRRTLALQEAEPAGLSGLDSVGRALWGCDDPAGFDPVDPPIRVAEVDGAPELSLALPAASPESLDIRHDGDALIVTVGTWRRAVSLPTRLRHRAVRRAVVRGGRLIVQFDSEDSWNR